MVNSSPPHQSEYIYHYWNWNARFEMQSFFISFFVNTVVISYFSLALKSKFKVITNCHQKKLTNLREQQERKISKSMTTYVKNTVHNFSSYQLTTEEYTALSNGLDRHIPCKFSSNSTYWVWTVSSKYFKRYITDTREWFMMFENQALQVP